MHDLLIIVWLENTLLHNIICGEHRFLPFLRSIFIWMLWNVLTWCFLTPTANIKLLPSMTATIIFMRWKDENQQHIGNGKFEKFIHTHYYLNGTTYKNKCMLYFAICDDKYYRQDFRITLYCKKNQTKIMCLLLLVLCLH